MPHIDALQLKGIREILAIRIVQRNCPLALILLFGNSPGGFRSTVLSTLSFWTEGLADVFGRIRKSTAKTIQPAQPLGLPGVIGGDPIMNDVIRKVRLVAPKESTVLLTGETGTGKEVFAKAVHTLSGRQNTEMVTVNCAALPEHLIESELFGHEKGSFTGAVNRRIGKFELAHNGTILLDEIGELPLQLQARLLRVLQEKKIERIGGNSTIHVNVRIIAATNRSLAREVAEGRFREDLYYRLNVYPVEIPPLRERLSDIPILWNHFLSLNAAKLQRAVPSSSPEVLRNLGSHDWPGNIRELQHLAERVLLTNTGNHISRVELPCRTRNEKDKGAMVIQPLCDMEREYISKVITHCGGRISGKKGAAALLGLPPTTLLSKMQKLGIRKRLNIIPAAAID